MAVRSIASLSISFGLVAIPIKLYSATQSSAAIQFRLMAAGGARVRQQYVTESPPRSDLPPADKPEKIIVPDNEPRETLPLRSAVQGIAPQESPRSLPADDVIERTTLVKGYEYEKGKFVLFTPDELHSLQAGSRKTIDIVSFIPENAVDPIYYDKAYLLAPDKAGAKPYTLLLRAMRDTQRCAIAKWAFRAKEYVAQIRATEAGLVLQQLFYADEVRSMTELQFSPAEVADAELALAKQLIAQISADSYDPTEFVDEEKKRILDAVERKIAGQALTAPPQGIRAGNVVNLLEALRASLQAKHGAAPDSKDRSPSLAMRKPAKRAPRSSTAASAGSKTRSRKR